MNILLIFGASGELGKGAAKVLSNGKFDRIYLFVSRTDVSLKIKSNETFIEIKDLSVEDNVKNAFDKINYSKEDTLFLFSTIGGYTGGNKIWETSSDEWDKMFSKNLKANFLICKFFALAVQKAAGGSICLTSAYTGVSPEIGKAAYGTSKSALNYLVKTLALEGTEIGLSANAIAPLIIDTPSNREWGNEDDFTKWQKPEEIGEIVLDLFANYKSVTGNIIELKERLNI